MERISQTRISMCGELFVRRASGRSNVIAVTMSRRLTFNDYSIIGDSLVAKPRYALQTDGNEQVIVDALEKIGCSVIVIGRPVDLLVGYRKRNFLIEVKNPKTRYGAKDQSTTTQRDFFATWRGQARKLYTVEAALTLVTEAYRHDVRRILVGRQTLWARLSTSRHCKVRHLWSKEHQAKYWHSSCGLMTPFPKGAETEGRNCTNCLRALER